MKLKIFAPAKTQLLLPLALCASLLAGCQTPDLKPFRDSTAQIHDSVVSAKDIYLEEQLRIKTYLPDDAQPVFQGKIDQFQTNWNARVDIMEAMVRYAGSLALVADAPDKSKAALAGVSDSISELSVAAGPYAPAVEGAKTIALELVDLANRVRSAQQLKEAVLATDPKMQKVANILAADFSSMRREMEDRQESLQNLMDTPLSDQLHARHIVEKKIDKLAVKLDGNLKTNDLNTAVGVYNQDMAEVQKYLAETDKWYQPHVAEVAKARKELADHVKLFRDTEAALTQWGKAHATLTKALRDGLPMDWTLLKQSAERIQKAVNQISNQNNK